MTEPSEPSGSGSTTPPEASSQSSERKGGRGNPVLAGLFAWLLPGAGHFYLGRKARSLAFFLVITAFTLLGFRERTFPGPDGRLRTPLPIDTDAAVYESGAGRSRVDAAIRWSHYLGNWDVGAYVFRGTGREPQLVPDIANGRLIPVYAVTDQVGIDVQYTRNAWLWKLEAIGREGQGATFGAAVAGFEHTFYQAGGSPADVGLLVELLYDGRDATAPPTIYDDDVFVGTRLALNDPSDTQVLGGVVVDRDDGSIAAFLETARRFGDRYRLEFEARWFTNVDPSNFLAVFDRDSHVMLRVSRFF